MEDQTTKPLAPLVWDDKSDSAKIGILRDEVKLLMAQMRELADYARATRLMVQNHNHIDATNQVAFPAAVFDARPAAPQRKHPLD